MWDVITCPCPWYLVLIQHSSNGMTGQFGQAMGGCEHQPIISCLYNSNDMCQFSFSCVTKTKNLELILKENCHKKWQIHLRRSDQCCCAVCNILLCWTVLQRYPTESFGWWIFHYGWTTGEICDKNIFHKTTSIKKNVNMTVSNQWWEFILRRLLR